MRLVFDLETNAIDFSDGNFLPQIKEVLCMVTFDLDTHKVCKYYDTDGLRILGTRRIEEGIKEIKKADELIGHNIIQFDLPVLRKLFGFKPTCRVHDTLVTSRTLYPDRTGGHSLEEWGSRLGYPKGDHSDFTAFSEELLEYCERDVRLTVAVYDKLVQEYGPEKEYWAQAIELEHKVAEIIAEQERNGFYFNLPQARVYSSQWKKEINDGDVRVHAVIPKRVTNGPVVSKPYKISGDLTSRCRQVVDSWGIDPSLLCGPFCAFRYEHVDLESKEKQKSVLKELGWQPVAYTPAGGPKLDDSILSVGPVGETLARRNVLSHRRSLVDGLIDLAQEDHRVHGGANPCGTNTARMKHRRIANLPRVTSELGREVRSLFTVPPGRCLVGYDAKALELRMLAHYIGNEEYNAKVTTTDKTQDAHVLAAAAAGSDDRDLGKTINYALIFGAGDARLGSIIGGDRAAGEELRNQLYKSIPGFEHFVSRVKSAAKRGYIKAIDGRKLFVRPRKSPVNTLIQGSSSIFMKTVSKHLDEQAKHYGLPAFKVVDMHDEAQWECDPDYSSHLEELIRMAFALATEELELTCPQEPDVKVGQNWAETH